MALSTPIATLVTTTAYGTWLPGDLRGYVDRGQTLPENPALLNSAKSMMATSPVHFTSEHQRALFGALLAAAAEFQYTLTDASIETWHVHWIISHIDSAPRMVGRLKNRMRQALNIGRIWTEGYSAEFLWDDAAVADAQAYVAKHAGSRLAQGVVVRR